MLKRVKKWLSYNSPPAATSEDWDTFYKEFSRKAPFRYFFTQSFPQLLDEMTGPFYRAGYGVIYRLHPRHRYHLMSTGLPPGYNDYDTRLLHVNFQALQDYVERELAHMEIICNGEHKINWFKDKFISDRYPELGLKYLKWEMSLTDSSPSQAAAAAELYKLYMWWVEDRPQRDDSSYDYDQEMAWGNEDTEMLVRLMTVRTAMWT